MRIRQFLSLTLALTFSSALHAAVLVTNLLPINATYDGGTNAEVGVGNPSHNAGLTYNIEFTPGAGDETNTVLLAEIGGTSNGNGLYLVNGVLTFIFKQGGNDAALPTGLDDVTIDPAMAITNSFGPVTPGVTYSAAASWDQVGTLILAVQADNLSTGRLDTISVSGAVAGGNWSGNDTFSVGVLPPSLGNVGGMSGNDVANDFGPPFDVNYMSNYSGTITRALYWNAVGQLTLFPTGGPSVLTWTNTGTGAYGVAANWSPNTVPGPADQPFINNGGKAQIADGTDYQLDKLYLAGGDGTSGTLEISNGSLTLTNSTQLLVTGVGANGTINLSGTGLLSLLGNNQFGSGGATATLNLSNGVVAADILRVGVDNNDVTVDGECHVNVYGGTLYVTNDLNAGRDNDRGYLTVNGGAVTNWNLSRGAQDWITIGGPNGTGVVTVISGTVYTETGVRMANGGTAQGTLSLNGGLLIAPTIFNPNDAGVARVEFNGGTLRALSNNIPLIVARDNFTVALKAGGATIDTAGNDVVVEEEITEDFSSPGGGLTKSGAGSLSIKSADYNGPTVVSAGSLEIGLPSYGTTAITVGNNANLGVKLNNSGASIYPSSLTFGTSATNTLTFAFADQSNPFSAPIAVSGGVSASGKVVINISGDNLVVGQFPLIGYSSLGGAGFSAFTLGTLPAGVSATLVNSGFSIDLNITAAGKSLAWSGAANSNWDTASVNWVDLLNFNAPASYSQPGGIGDNVTFDDSQNPVNTNINLTLTVLPRNMAVNNPFIDYSFSGSGSIGGAAALSKDGFGALTLSTSNSYRGGTFLNGGVLRLGSDSALGTNTLEVTGTNAPVRIAALGAAARTIPNNINYSTDITLGDTENNGVITLAGDVNLGTANRNMTLNSDLVVSGSISNPVPDVGLNSIDGPGKLTVTASGVVDIAELFEQLNAGGVVVDGGTFINREGYRLAAPQPNSTQMLLITNNGTFIMDHTPGTGGNVVIGTSQAGAESDATATNLIELASGTLVARTPSGGNGQILFSQNNGGAASIMNVRSGSTVQCRRFLGQQGTSGRVSELNLYGGTLKPIADVNNFIANLTAARIHTGDVTVDTGTNNITIPQSLLAGTGGGGLTKVGSGNLLLTGTNTYTGTTLVSAGALGGSGIIAGPVTVASGATLAPGTTGIGTLTVNNTLGLAGTVLAEVSLNGGVTNNDRVVGLTGVTYGGSLVITNTGTNALAVGMTFDLFDGAPGTGNFSSITVVPDAGLTGTLDPATGVVTLVSAGAPELTWANLGGGVIQFSFDSGYKLVWQTNALSVGLSNNWMDYPDASNPVTVTNDPAIPASFFGLQPQ